MGLEDFIDVQRGLEGFRWIWFRGVHGVSDGVGVCFVGGLDWVRGDQSVSDGFGAVWMGLDKYGLVQSGLDGFGAV